MSNIRGWFHFVWSTKKRKPLMTKEIRQDIFDHIRENAKTKDIYIDFINGHKDHVHILVSINSMQTLSEIAQMIKGESSFWINKNNLTREKFQWQKRYWAVSIGLSEINGIRDYIKGQEEHHRYKSFKEEVDEFIEKYGLESFEDD
jgi:REP element-mobilizing transposase RayT